MAWLFVVGTLAFVVVTYRILDARYDRRVEAGLADPEPTMAEVWARLRNRLRRTGHDG
jgi:hypothetical protein